MREDMTIQWFPGHMAKARRMIAQQLKLVDAVCEIVDARIPLSSRNPDVDELVGGKPRLIILNRVDQADPDLTKRWRPISGHSATPSWRRTARPAGAPAALPRPSGTF